jgi:hypothetical protein
VLRYAGQTHPIKPAHRRDVVAALTGLPFRGDGAGHPWPCPLPPAWAGDFGDRQPLPFTPVEPTTVAEVEVDTARDGPFGRARHGCRLVRVRLDLPRTGPAPAMSQPRRDGAH